MIDDEPAQGPRLALDLVRGAIDAHRHPGALGLPAGRFRSWLTRDRVTGLLLFALGIAWAIPYLTIAITTMPWTPNPDPFPLVMTAVLTTWVAPMLAVLLWGSATGTSRGWVPSSAWPGWGWGGRSGVGRRFRSGRTPGWRHTPEHAAGSQPPRTLTIGGRRASSNG